MAGGPAAVAAWWSAAAQVLVEDLDEPALSDADLHHLGRVLRLRPGSSVCATDGGGGWQLCSFTGDAELEPTGDGGREEPPSHEVGVGFALVKGERPELVVQKLTELGVDRIAVFAARRSVVRWDEARGAKHLERLQKVAREACGQCRRLFVPSVGLAELSDLGAGSGVVAAQAGGRPLGDEDRMVLIGPEGGWQPDELGDLVSVTLGEHVLRAETAAITAGALLCSLRSGSIRTAGA
jgi:16S rRNA (uracil1498-N3)-methyltransferase